RICETAECERDAAERRAAQARALGQIDSIVTLLVARFDVDASSWTSRLRALSPQRLQALVVAAATASTLHAFQEALE
ncbi:MAG: hypothetical protein AAFS10_18545, partial [Myxococcota bacterium]